MAWDGSSLGMISVVSTLWGDESCHCWWMWTQSVMVNLLNLNDTGSPCQVCTNHCSASLWMWPGGKRILLILEEVSPLFWCYFGISDQTRWTSAPIANFLHDGDINQLSFHPESHSQDLGKKPKPGHTGSLSVDYKNYSKPGEVAHCVKVCACQSWQVSSFPGTIMVARTGIL